MQALAPGAMLKVRTEPGSADSDDSAGARVLGRIGRKDCVIALASSGDWLQVRYMNYEAAWMLMTYKGRMLLAPLSVVHPGVVIRVAFEGSGAGGVRKSPFPISPEVLEKEEQERAMADDIAAAANEAGSTAVDGFY